MLLLLNAIQLAIEERAHNVEEGDVFTHYQLLQSCEREKQFKALKH